MKSEYVKITIEALRQLNDEIDRLKKLEEGIDDIKSDEYRRGYDDGHLDGSGYGERL